MSDEELSEVQNQLLATYGGTNIETICRELTAVEDSGVDPDFRPRVLSGLPWWTMKIPQVLKYRSLLEKAWNEGHYASNTEWEHTYYGHPVPEGEICPECSAGNPYRKEQDK